MQIRAFYKLKNKMVKRDFTLQGKPRVSAQSADEFSIKDEFGYRSKQFSSENNGTCLSGRVTSRNNFVRG